jgi:phosphatidate cytidylyltransferase
MQPRDPQLAIWIGAIFGLFAVLIVAGQLVTRRRIDGIWRMFAVQVLTTTWLIGGAWAGGPWFSAVVLLTAAVTAFEMTGVVARLGMRPARAAVVIASVAYGIAALAHDPIWLAAAPAVFALAMLARPVVSGPLDRAFADGAASLMASLYPGFCLAFAIRIAHGGNALGDMLFLFVVLEVNDACAFLVGRLIGRRRYAPVLSPKKTIEGAAGGVIGAMLAGAALAPVLPGTTPITGAALGLLLAAAGQTADLAASAIKRQAGVKDYANTIPTQGGVLDVYDAIIMVMPVWFLIRMAW